MVPRKINQEGHDVDAYVVTSMLAKFGLTAPQIPGLFFFGGGGHFYLILVWLLLVGRILSFGSTNRDSIIVNPLAQS